MNPQKIYTALLTADLAAAEGTPIACIDPPRLAARRHLNVRLWPLLSPERQA